MKRFEKAEILLHQGDLESDTGFGTLLKCPLTDGTAKIIAFSLINTFAKIL